MYVKRSSDHDSRTESELELIYCNDMSPFGFLKICRTIAANSTVFDFSKDEFVTEQKRLFNYSIPLAAKANPNLALPPRDYANVLMEMLLRNLNQMTYLFNDELFESFILDPVYSSPDTVEDYKLCLLLFTLAAGAVFAEALHQTVPGSIEYRKDIDSVSLFQTALTMIPKLSTEPNICSTEIYYMITIFYIFQNRPFKLWISLGTAIRYGLSSELNKNFINEMYQDPDYVLHRKKLWRSLFCTDVVLSTLIGRLPSITELDLHGLSEPLLENRDFVDECEHQLVKLTYIISNMLKYMFTNLTPTLDIKTLMKIALQFRDWDVQLPYELKLEQFLEIGKIYDTLTGGYKKNTKYAYHPLFFLYLTNAHGVMVFTRPFLLLTIMRTLHYIEHGYYDIAISECSIIKVFANTCYNASKFCITLAELFWQKGIRPDKPFATVNSVFHSGLIMGAVYYLRVTRAVKGCPFPDDAMGFLYEDAELLLLNARRMLRNFAHIDPISERYSEILNAMYSMLKDKEKDLSYNLVKKGDPEMYNVKRNFEKIRFTGLDEITEESQEVDIKSMNLFIRKYRGGGYTCIIKDGMI